jgi:hypothetical protein
VSIIKVTSLKTSITKSRSGHYTASIREIGTWQQVEGGQSFPYEKRVLHETKIELATAQALINKFKAD